MTCGTYGGYQMHARRGEEPCDDCRDANNEYMRDWRKRNPGRKHHDTRVRQARDKAMRRLTLLHPRDFHRLLMEERRRQLGGSPHDQ